MPAISDIISVRASIAAVAPPARDFGRTLFFFPATDDPDDEDYVAKGRAAAVEGRIYSSLEEVGTDFATTHAVYQAAKVYFQQVPFPRPFVAGGWFEDGAKDVLIGGTLGSGAPAAIAGVTSPAYTINGESPSAAVDFTGNTAMTAIAATLQTNMRLVPGVDSSTTVTFDSDHLRVEGLAGTLNFLVGNVADELGLDAANAKYYRGATNPETVGTAMERLANNRDFYWITLHPDIYGTQANAEAVATWVNADIYQAIIDSVQPGVLTPSESSSIAAALSEDEYSRVSVIWSRNADYKAVSLAGRFSSVNFEAADSLITGKFKQLPGTTPDDITRTQKAELDRKRINHYSPYGGSNIVAEGWTLDDDTWMDVRYWLDWFISTVQSDIFTLFRADPGRIPQTDDGIAAIQNTIGAVCERGRTNGGIAPGQLEAGLANQIRSATGNNDFTGFLTTGYLIYIRPLSLQTRADREARKSPPAQVWLKGSGAIHFLDIAVVFEN